MPAHFRHHEKIGATTPTPKAETDGAEAPDSGRPGPTARRHSKASWRNLARRTQSGRNRSNVPSSAPMLRLHRYAARPKPNFASCTAGGRRVAAITVAGGWTRTTRDFSLFHYFINSEGLNEGIEPSTNEAWFVALPTELKQRCLSCHDSLGTHRAMNSVSAPAGFGTRCR